MARKRIGELLLERGAITPAQLEAALAYQRQTGFRLGAALVAQRAISEDDLCRALAAALGLEVVELPAAEVEWSALHALRDRFCEANDLFPVSLAEGRGRKVLTVAMADPLNLPAIEEIEFTTGMKVQPRLATLSQVRAAIRKHYLKQSGDGTDGAIVAAGGAPIHAATAVPPRPRAEEARLPEAVLVGEEASASPRPDVTARTALADLIRQREAQRRKPGRRPKTLETDLEYLMGEPLHRPDPAEHLERLERHFWALMRLMAKKGLFSREEYLSEFDE